MKRNILVYVKNRTNVFFSFLSMLIVVGLMVIFLGDMNIDNIVYELKEYGGTRDAAADRANASIYVISWVVAGLIIVNSVSVSLAVVGMLIEDKERNRLNSLFIAPVKRVFFVLSYVLAAFLVTSVFGIFTVVISEVVIVASGGALLTLVQMAKMLGLVFLCAFTFSSLSFLFTLAVNSNSAFSSLSTIVCTLVGFMAAIYIPLGALPETVQKILKFFPMLFGSSLVRKVYTESIANTMFAGVPMEAADEIQQYMGTSIVYGSSNASELLLVLLMIGSGVLFLAIATVIMKKKHLTDR